MKRWLELFAVTGLGAAAGALALTVYANVLIQRPARSASATSRPFTFAIHNVDGLSHSNSPYGLDTQHPTNIEVTFGAEPVVSRGIKGGWVVHFKE